MQWMGFQKKRPTSKVRSHLNENSKLHNHDVDRGLTNCDHRVGEYKVILQLVSVLSHGKLAKRLTDRAIDQMQDVQNLRKAIYECVLRLPRRAVALRQGLTAPFPLDLGASSYKLKVAACEKGSAKQRKLMDLGVNYLYGVFPESGLCMADC